MEYIKSPIYYTGNKYRLLDELQNFIPDEINTFIDVFGGSGVMAINLSLRSKEVIYNELNTNIYNLFKYLIDTDFNKVNDFIVEKSKKFNIYAEKEDNITSNEYNQYKINFYKFRDYINDNKLQNSPEWYYILSHYSFCNSITWNKKGLLDVSYGARIYKKDIIEINLKHTQYYLNKKIKIYNLSFEKLLTDEYINSLTKDDYVYLDPPYFGTNASYNSLWNITHEMLLLEIIDKLNSKGVSFGLSNIYKNKHITNDHLIDWAKKNNYTIHYPNITYNFGGNGNSESVEVFISNKIVNYQPTLFGDSL